MAITQERMFALMRETTTLLQYIEDLRKEVSTMPPSPEINYIEKMLRPFATPILEAEKAHFSKVGKMNARRTRQHRAERGSITTRELQPVWDNPEERINGNWVPPATYSQANAGTFDNLEGIRKEVEKMTLNTPDVKARLLAEYEPKLKEMFPNLPHIPVFEAAYAAAKGTSTLEEAIYLLTNMVQDAKDLPIPGEKLF